MTPPIPSLTMHPPDRPTTDPHATAGGDPLMTLTDLIGLQGQALEAGADVPCHDNDAELWFAETPEGVEFAKALCGTCPARAECLAGALDRREPWGVWGGGPGSG